ncbi:MAG: hypothetical protein WCW35_00505 [Bacteroidota bacterium]|jgi:hypothetical protein
MGLGQTMITSAFLVLLTIAAMNANKMIVDRDSNYYEQEAFRQAGNLANALLSEIVRKKFDELADTSGVFQPVTAFTTSGNLGAAVDTYRDSVKIMWWWIYIYPSETSKVPLPDTLADPDIPNYKSINSNWYDDVDDYNGYERRAQSGTITGFILTVDVYYVNASDLNTVTASKTYYKKIVVSVTNPTYFPKRDLDGDGDEDDDITLTFSTIKSY